MLRLAIWLGVVFLLCGRAAAQDHYEYDNPPLVAGSFIDTVYTATLTSAQVVPPVLSFNGWGTAYCDLNQNTNVMFCHVCHNVETPVSATISLGDRRQVGTVVYQLDVEPDNFFEQAFQLEDRDDYPLFSQLQDFLFGRWYITVNDELRDFSIRGQLEQNDNIYSLMSSEDTSPRAQGSPHRGITLGTYTANNPRRVASYDLCHDVSDATFAVIGRGVPGFPGEFVFNFRDVDPPITAEFKYTIDEERELLTGYQYAQVRSQSNPQGAVRGQLRRVDPIPTLAVTGRMDGNQAGVTDTFARGCILVSFNCDSRLMEFLVYHSVSQPTSLEVRTAPAGSRGTLLFTLTTVNQKLESPIYGSRVLTAEQEYVLYAQQMYFQLNSANFPEGEIRGQLTTQYDFFALMTGLQVVPPVTTANLGCATFDLTDLNYNLDFEIMHSIEDVVAVDLFRGGIGDSGDITSVRRFLGGNYRNSLESPLIGDMLLDDDEQRDWITDSSFVQVASERFPEGEIRGQVTRILPCDPNPRNGERPSDSRSFNPSIDSIIELPLTRNGASSVLPEVFLLALMSVMILGFHFA